jgi:hypothetical protein
VEAPKRLNPSYAPDSAIVQTTLEVPISIAADTCRIAPGNLRLALSAYALFYYSKTFQIIKVFFELFHAFLCFFYIPDAFFRNSPGYLSHFAALYTKTGENVVWQGKPRRR